MRDKGVTAAEIDALYKTIEVRKVDEFNIPGKKKPRTGKTLVKA